jgi:hypothetical protein
MMSIWSLSGELKCGAKLLKDDQVGLERSPGLTAHSTKYVLIMTNTAFARI